MAEEIGASVSPSGQRERFPAGRRREPRYSLRQEPPCRLVLRDPPEAWWARVRDVSAGGAGLALSQRPVPGSRLTVELRAAGPPLVREARIVYAAAGPGPGWRAGCAFDRPLAVEELRTLVGRGGE